MEAEEYSEGSHISEHLERIRQNIELNTKDPVARGGFTQVPNFILEHPNLSIGAKVIYAMFLRYAWHNNLVFPGQQRLADAIGMSVSRVNDFVKELEKAKLVEITRRGQGRTNHYKINFVVQKKKPTRNGDKNS